MFWYHFEEIIHSTIPPSETTAAYLFSHASVTVSFIHLGQGLAWHIFVGFGIVFFLLCSKRSFLTTHHTSNEYVKSRHIDRTSPVDITSKRSVSSLAPALSLLQVPLATSEVCK